MAGTVVITLPDDFTTRVPDTLGPCPVALVSFGWNGVTLCEPCWSDPDAWGYSMSLHEMGMQPIDVYSMRGHWGDWSHVLHDPNVRRGPSVGFEGYRMPVSLIWNVTFTSTDDYVRLLTSLASVEDYEVDGIRIRFEMVWVPIYMMPGVHLSLFMTFAVTVSRRFAALCLLDFLDCSGDEFSLCPVDEYAYRHAMLSLHERGGVCVFDSRYWQRVWRHTPVWHRPAAWECRLSTIAYRGPWFDILMDLLWDMYVDGFKG
jgi:hypothetical protein